MKMHKNMLLVIFVCVAKEMLQVNLQKITIEYCFTFLLATMAIGDLNVFLIDNDIVID